MSSHNICFCGEIRKNIFLIVYLELCYCEPHPNFTGKYIHSSFLKVSNSSDLFLHKIVVFYVIILPSSKHD